MNKLSHWDYCQYLLVSQINYTQTYFADHTDRFSHDQVNRLMREIDRAWLYDEGLPNRPWYRNLYAAPDEDSGYAAWMLPALRYAVERGDHKVLDGCEELYLRVFDKLTGMMRDLESLLPD